jgi:RNA polymerase sigma-70 factor, ECF subfamily
MIRNSQVAFVPRHGLSNQQLTAIHRQYGQLLLRRCQLRLGNLAAAEDALQEVFLKIMRHGSAYTDATCKLSWLYRVAHNCCFDLLGRQRDRAAPADVAPLADVAGSDGQPRLMARLQVRRALARLSASDRQLAVLALVEGLSQARIGIELGRSRQTINQRLRTIREQLAASL